MLERGSAHPILGPVLLILLVLLLAMVFLHVAHEGIDVAAGMGAICVGIAAALGLLVTNRLRFSLSAELDSRPGARGPPRPSEDVPRRPPALATSLSIPLRR
jgi:hypothetical protein